MTKRTSDQFLEMDDDQLEYQLENVPVTDSCDAVRRKIRALIDNNEMKVGEFQKAINVTPNAYSRFMGQNGPHKGMESSVYMSAWAFFKKREMKGIKTMPNKKAKAGAANDKDTVPSVDDVELEGEKEDKVPVYEVRRKINVHLKKPGVTQAALLRNIAAQYHTALKKPQSTQLSAFRSKKGPYAGNTSAIFYGAYVYFEKLRIKEGKPKSKKRQEMEKVHAEEGGLDTKHRREWFTCIGNERPSIDKYGKVSFFEKP